MKTCSKCNKSKPLGEYYSNGGGYEVHKCKTCISIQTKERRAKEKLFKETGLNTLEVIRFSFRQWCEHEGSEFKRYTVEELLCMHSN